MLPNPPRCSSVQSVKQVSSPRTDKRMMKSFCDRRRFAHAARSSSAVGQAPTARVVLNGNAIRIDSAQEDNGVWLEDLKTGEKLADGTVIHSDSATCHVTFPTLPATGKYRLVLATRDGNDPNEFSLAKVTRNVTVIHEANA